MLWWRLRKLRRQLSGSFSDNARAVAAKELGKIGDKRSVEPLIAALKDSDDRVQAAAAIALGRSRDPRAFEPLVAAFEQGTAEVAGALVSLGDPRAVEFLISKLFEYSKVAESPFHARTAVVLALAETCDPRAVDALTVVLTDESSPGRKLLCVSWWQAIDELVKREEFEKLEAFGEVAVEPVKHFHSVYKYGRRERLTRVLARIQPAEFGPTICAQIFEEMIKTNGTVLDSIRRLVTDYGEQRTGEMLKHFMINTLPGRKFPYLVDDCWELFWGGVISDCISLVAWLRPRGTISELIGLCHQLRASASDRTAKELLTVIFTSASPYLPESHKIWVSGYYQCGHDDMDTVIESQVYDKEGILLCGDAGWSALPRHRPDDAWWLLSSSALLKVVAKDHSHAYQGGRYFFTRTSWEGTLREIDIETFVNDHNAHICTVADGISHYLYYSAFQEANTQNG